MRRTIALLLAAAIALPAAGCRGLQRLPEFSPHETLLSIAAEFELLAVEDPYREAPRQVLTGQNAARATLVRLANYESLHPDRFPPETAMLRAKAYEHLRDFPSAVLAYEEAASYDSPLRAECLRRVGILRRFLEIEEALADAESLDEVLETLAEQAARYRSLAQDLGPGIHRALALAEAEQAEVVRAELAAANRWVLEDGEARAEALLAALFRDHADSHRALAHALRLADYHFEVGREHSRLNPPYTLEFDRGLFVARMDAALDLYYRVSQADGRPERLEAQHRLDAALAFRDAVLARAE